MAITIQSAKKRLSKAKRAQEENTRAIASIKNNPNPDPRLRGAEENRISKLTAELPYIEAEVAEAQADLDASEAAFDASKSSRIAELKYKQALVALEISKANAKHAAIQAKIDLLSKAQ